MFCCGIFEFCFLLLQRWSWLKQAVKVLEDQLDVFEADFQVLLVWVYSSLYSRPSLVQWLRYDLGLLMPWVFSLSTLAAQNLEPSVILKNVQRVFAWPLKGHSIDLSPILDSREPCADPRSLSLHRSPLSGTLPHNIQCPQPPQFLFPQLSKIIVLSFPSLQCDPKCTSLLLQEGKYSTR